MIIRKFKKKKMMPSTRSILFTQCLRERLGLIMLNEINLDVQSAGDSVTTLIDRNLFTEICDWRPH